jgi:hypothetical protein
MLMSFVCRTEVGFMSQAMHSEEMCRKVEREYFQLPPPEYATIELIHHDGDGDGEEGMVEPVLVVPA